MVWHHEWVIADGIRTWFWGYHAEHYTSCAIRSIFPTDKMRWDVVRMLAQCARRMHAGHRKAICKWMTFYTLKSCSVANQSSGYHTLQQLSVSALHEQSLTSDVYASRDDIALVLLDFESKWVKIEPFSRTAQRPCLCRIHSSMPSPTCMGAGVTTGCLGA